MPANQERKYRQTIEYIEDILGGDINRDLIRVAIAAQDNDTLTVQTDTDSTLDININELGGEAQTAGDLAELLEQIAQLRLALQSVENDELRTKPYINDKAGNLQAVEGQPLDVTTDTSQVGQVTYLARALKANDLDQLIARVTDSKGQEIDPMPDSALETVGDDELRANVYGVNENQDLRQFRFNTLSQDITDNLYGIVTYLARALESVGDDTLRTQEINSNESEYGVKDDHIATGEEWVIRIGERLDIGTLQIDGTLWLDEELYVYDSLKGDGSIKSDGRIISRT